MEYNAKCAICGNPYYKCNSCSNSKLKPWLSIVDTINHFKIYTIIAEYTNRKIDKSKAEMLLSQCDISDYKRFLPEISNVICEILKQEPKKACKKVKEINE